MTPYDENVKARQEEKAKKYVPLAAELASECARGAEVSRVTLVIGALGTVMGLERELGKMMNVKSEVRFVAERMQRATICGTLRLINKFKMMR